MWHSRCSAYTDVVSFSYTRFEKAKRQPESLESVLDRLAQSLITAGKLPLALLVDIGDMFVRSSICKWVNKVCMVALYTVCYAKQHSTRVLNAAYCQTFTVTLEL